jgi:hypothetical protein
VVVKIEIHSNIERERHYNLERVSRELERFIVSEILGCNWVLGSEKY